MSIDMKDFMGEYSVGEAVTPILPPTPAAGESQNVDTNSYQAQEEYPMPDMPSHEAPVTKVQEEPVKQEDPQERNFRALAAEVDRIKAERETEKREYKLQLDMLRVNQRQEPAPKQEKMFEGMEETEVPNVGEIRKAWDRKEADYAARIEELQVANRFSDYAEVVEKFAAPLVNEKPHLLQGILKADNKAQALYELGKLVQQSRQAPTPAQPQQTQQSTIAQKIVENARKPGNLGSAGGQTSLSKADYFATMSDQEFAKFASKNLGEI